MHQQLPEAAPAVDRVLGLRDLTDEDVRHRWHINTGTQRTSSRTPTDDEWRKAADDEAASARKWYDIGFRQWMEQFSDVPDDKLILNYWHFFVRGQHRWSAYAQGLRDACATMAAHRGVVIPDRDDRTEPQRCICWYCTHQEAS